MGYVLIELKAVSEKLRVWKSKNLRR